MASVRTAQQTTTITPGRCYTGYTWYGVWLFLTIVKYCYQPKLVRKVVALNKQTIINILTIGGHHLSKHISLSSPSGELVSVYFDTY